MPGPETATKLELDAVVDADLPPVVDWPRPAVVDVVALPFLVVVEALAQFVHRLVISLNASAVDPVFEFHFNLFWADNEHPRTFVVDEISSAVVSAREFATAAASHSLKLSM